MWVVAFEEVEGPPRRQPGRPGPARKAQTSPPTQPERRGAGGEGRIGRPRGPPRRNNGVSAVVALLLRREVAAPWPTTRPLRIVAMGAHPDDAELKFAGTAAMFAAQGAKVKLVALTNGDVGHFAQAGGPLAQRRKAEVEACHKQIGVETDVLDIHDGELMADLPTRKMVGNIIREWQADIVLSHRPYDYHPDHRAVGQLANDTAVVVAAPFFAPYTPPVKLNPVYLYYSDAFTHPYPFDPILAVGIDKVAQKKWDCISALPSQFGDAPSLAGALPSIIPHRRERAQGGAHRTGEAVEHGRRDQVPRHDGEGIRAAEGRGVQVPGVRAQSSTARRRRRTI